jgi:hypothetical protein
MKRALLAFVLFAASVPAFAQETYSLPAGAGNVTTLSVVITGMNGGICVASGLPRTCTQAQACTATGAPGGASCSAAQARAAGIRIYPLTQPGREEFVTWVIAVPKFLELVAAQQAEMVRAACEAWNALTQGQRDTVCTATLGLPAGCSFGCP